MEGKSFAELCYHHTYAGCGCGMCKAGDVCPTPVLKLEDAPQGDAVSERIPGALVLELKN